MALFFRKFCRHHNINGDELIAPASLPQAYDSLISQAEHRTALSAFRHFEAFFAFESGNGDVGTQDRLRDPDRNLAINIVSLSLEKRVLFHIDDDVEVSGRTVMDSGFPFSLNSQSGAIIDAGWDSYFQHFFSVNTAATAACFTRFCDHSTGAVALTACPAYGKESLLIAHLTGTMACGANGRILAFRSSPAIALFACILSRDFDLCLDAESGFAERNLQIVAQVGTTLRTAPAASPENISESKKFPENISKITKGGGIKTAETSLQSAMTLSIVACAFFRIAQNAVRFGGFLKLFLGVLITLVRIRMIL